MNRNLLVAVGLLLTFQLSGQQLAQDWYLLDPETDNVQGISLEKTYVELLKDRESRTVLVAVIDGGVDVEHEDLQEVIWINENEIAGNGVDDDKNGYIDDIHGWNFIGGENGNVDKDTYELTREYIRLKEKFEGVKENKVSKKQKNEYDYWTRVKADFETTRQEASLQYNFYRELQRNIVRFNELIKSYLGKEELTTQDVAGIQSSDSLIMVAKEINLQVLRMMGEDADFELLAEELGNTAEHFETQVKYGYNTEFNPRPIVGDDYGNKNEKIYGNNNVTGPDADHGTHIAGIIAANRGNDIGVKGIADNVRIMAVRAVPDGDERDKDVANAIIYAVDNGADIINMSFGKYYSPHKDLVNDAIKYAERKGVLLIHAAGNDGKNIDKEEHYPTRWIGNNKEAANWIETGAAGWGANENFIAPFSNYGKKTVDIFAPGVEIYSTITGSEYDVFQGTSMAAPIVTGVAALLMSYFPDLTVSQIKDILIRSSRKFNELMVIRPNSEDQIEFSELSRSGGLINAYEAVKMAQSIALEGAK